MGLCQGRSSFNCAPPRAWTGSIHIFIRLRRGQFNAGHLKRGRKLGQPFRNAYRAHKIWGSLIDYGKHTGVWCPMQNQAPTQAKSGGLHYGWVVAITGLWVVFACLGLARFGLGMLLPSMGQALKLDYSQMGLISTANFVGYMASVALAGYLNRYLRPRLCITLGLILVGSCMVLMSQVQNFIFAALFYLITGVGSGLANVPMMGLASVWFTKSTRGRAAGIIVGGSGFAIMFSAFFVPYMNQMLGAEGWRTSWVIMGMMGMLIACVAALVLRNSPAEKGLEPFGRPDAPTVHAGAHDPVESKKANRNSLVRLGVIFSLFGATYVVYATFIVTALINERGYSQDAAGYFWAVVGALSLISGPLYGGISDRLGRKWGLICAYGTFTLSYALVALSLPGVFLYASIGFFGIAAWSIPTVMAAAVGDYIGPSHAVRSFAFVTLFFGAGQVVGPAVAGYLADWTGSFAPSFAMCAVLTSLAVFLSLGLKKPRD